MNEQTGVVRASFTTLGTNSGTLTGSLASLQQAATAAAGALSSVAGMGGVGGGGDFTNLSGSGGVYKASYGGGGRLPSGSGNGGGWNPSSIGSGGWAQSGATKGQVADYIRRAAALNHIEPDVMVRVAASEGLNVYKGDYGTSFGAMQLHYGGSGIRGMNAGGLGDVFTRMTGLDARDPKTWKQQIDFAAAYAAKHGWGDWHGAARVGIGRMQGIGTYHGPVPNVAPPPRRGPAAAPTPGTTSAQNLRQVHEHHIYVQLDKKTISKSVIASLADSGVHPTGMGGPDPHGHYVSPGTPVTDAA